ncbi:MAG: type I-U CRISPR-associated protein Cas5/Cas6 [Planctomycetes bacterium]|nr:type I-U CRISPR-associated protein Cas5/Cas6 [Planctomycetota bacterium]
MLAVGLCYLTGRVYAVAPGTDSEPEWPPHPGRVFMALVAALNEGRGSPDPQERAALEWLERLPPPSICAAAATPRQAVTAYVPVNDTPDPGGHPPFAPHIPIGRKRQARSFASASLEDDLAFMVWPEAEPTPEVRRALEAVCGRVTRVGHSASLVQAWIEPSPPPVTLIPGSSRVTHRLRVAGPGRLAELDARFAAGLRPSPGRFVGYGSVAREEAIAVAESEFQDDLTVLRRVAGLTPALESSAVLAGALRDALMCWSPAQPAPEILTGHSVGGGPSTQTHAAFLPLANVGHGHADGRVIGLAIALPRAATPDSRTTVARALSRWLAPAGEGGGGGELRLRPGLVTFALEDRSVPPRSLDPRTWTRPRDPAARWSSVTPVVLDRYPKRPGDEEAIVRAACLRIGLPEPLDVIVSDVSLIAGAPPGRRFPPFPSKRGPRPMRHVVLTFDRPVVGPILLGAGRYQGYGLCCPLQG